MSKPRYRYHVSPTYPTTINVGVLLLVWDGPELVDVQTYRVPAGLDALLIDVASWEEGRGLSCAAGRPLTWAEACDGWRNQWRHAPLQDREPPLQDHEPAAVEPSQRRMWTRPAPLTHAEPAPPAVPATAPAPAWVGREASDLDPDRLVDPHRDDWR